MNRKMLKNLILLFVPLIAIIIVGINLVNSGIITFEKPLLDSEAADVKLMISYDGKNVDTYNVKLTNPTVYNVMVQAAADYDLTFKADFYNQYQSNYIYSINSVEEGNNLYWQYYLNGNYGVLGANLQVVKDNDLIEWKLEEAQI